MRRFFWRFCLAVTLLALGAGVSPASQGGQVAPAQAADRPPKEAEMVTARVPVKTVTAQVRDLEITLPVFGSVTYLEKVDIASEVLGVLKDVRVKPGDLIKKGQVLAVMDTDLLLADLKTKTALKAEAEAQLHLAAWHYQAQKKVYRAGGISLKDLEEAEANYLSKKAEVARYAAEMGQILTQIRKATITSPINGIVGAKNFNVGERVPSQSEKGIVTLMQVEEVYVEAEINEQDLARVHVGLKATVFPDAFPGSALHGKIARVEPVLKQESRSAIAKILVANPQLALKPGMFCRIEIVLDQVPHVVAIPPQALRRGADKSWQVFVVSDEIAILRNVVPGLTTANWVEIKEGLKPGEAVVVEGAERLHDLSRVISTKAAP
jgi:membrane fusion protein (multidrug efflux system)